MDKQNTEENEVKRTRRRSYVVDLRIHSPTSLAYLGIEGIDTAPAMVRLAVPESAEGDEKYIVQKEFSEILNVIEEFDALVIPSRMDKTPHRKNAIKILVEDYGFRAFDLAYFPDSTKIFKENWPNTEFELLSFSNANALAQIGSRISKVKMHKPGFSGLKDITARITK